MDSDQNDDQCDQREQNHSLDARIMAASVYGDDDGCGEMSRQEHR